jgi:phosphatidylglycerol:prolipoprotein diacylglycerol transferase
MEDALYFVWDQSPSFHLFGFELRYYGVLFATTFLVGYFLMRRMFLRLGYAESQAQNFYFLGMGMTVVFARLFHVFFYEFDRVMAEPAYIVRIWEGGVASHGGVFGLILACWLFTRFTNMRLFDLLDSVAPAVAGSAFFIRVGNFMNSEIVGRPTDVPWAIIFKRYDALPRHPSQLYEAAYGLTLLILLFALERWRDRRKAETGERWTGLLFFLGSIFYLTCRFLAEYFKEYQALSPSFPLTMGQLLTFPFVVFSVVGLVVIVRRNRAGLDPV